MLTCTPPSLVSRGRPRKDAQAAAKPAAAKPKGAKPKAAPKAAAAKKAKPKAAAAKPADADAAALLKLLPKELPADGKLPRSLVKNLAAFAETSRSLYAWHGGFWFPHGAHGCALPPLARAGHIHAALPHFHCYIVRRSLLAGSGRHGGGG